MNFNIVCFTPADKINILIAAAALFVSIIVLRITYLTWKLKYGQAVRASIGIARTDKTYVSNVVIENLKDRDLIIYAIYLKFGANVYIDLLDIDYHFDRYTHIIPGLSTRIFELGPPLYYTKSSMEVDIENLLNNWTAGSIVLHTNIGLIKAKKIKDNWHPIAQYFKNYGTVYIRPRRFYTKDSVPSSKKQSENYIDYSSYESSVIYVVSLKFVDGTIYDFEIPPTHNYVPFQKLDFSADVLENEDTLRKYFIRCQENGVIDFEEIVNITNIQKIIKKDRHLGRCDETSYKIKVLNWFEYNIIWYFKTQWYNWKSNKKKRVTYNTEAPILTRNDKPKKTKQLKGRNNKTHKKRKRKNR
ncbi:MAG: hypothetical protein HDS07_04055 [Bacteroides sp.]|nr:hypothetical protein [Bacteroides sp.]